VEGEGEMESQGQSDLAVKGFRFSAVACGIKKQAGELDLALIYSQKPATVAGAFTTNRVAAAPVVLDRERLRSGKARAILTNAGCANACTGPSGYEDAVATSRWVAEELGLQTEEVMVASTGVIGARLPVERIRAGVSPLIAALRDDGLPDAARAIMTTDTRPKWAFREGKLGGVAVRVAGMAKGAGMIHPQMATMLCFVVTDAAVPAPVLQKALKLGLERSFHAITVDGDTSTNDTVLVLANGASGSPVLEEWTPEAEIFQRLLGEVLEDLAMAIVRDAEGATKLVHLMVEGAPDGASAQRIARSIAHSPLVKTALYGEEVNWGRIMAAVGYSGVPVDPNGIDLWYEGVQLVRGGQGADAQSEARALEVARRPEFTIRLTLGMGEGRALLHTCDLSHDYVTINGSYKT
jgi:glutamate N-acetyltransferase / amino-acid N-acetyltransferase